MEPPAPETIAISPASVSLTQMEPGATTQLGATVRDQNGLAIEDAMVSWTSSDTSVAVVVGDGLLGRVTVVGGGSTVVSASVGTLEATATVTATDPDELEARIAFGVTVPNRPPEFKTPFDTLAVLIGDTLFVTLAEHFEDPDGHALTYEIGSADTAAVAAVVDGPRLRLSGRAPGPTEVTVVANDGWGSVEGSAPIEIPVPVTSFRDDFDSDASLDDWTVVRAGVSIEGGRLHVSPDTTLEGYVHRHTGDAPAATDWKIKVSMAAADSLGVAAVKWQARVGEHRAYYFSVGRPSTLDSINWEFGVCIITFPCGRYGGGDDQWGWSDEIEVGVLQEFHIWMEEKRVYVRIGEDGPWLMNGVSPENQNASPDLHGRLELGMLFDEDIDIDRQGLTAIYDWVELVVN